MPEKQASAPGRGRSGKIVINVDPDLKARMYSALKRVDRTMKGWFTDAATGFCDDQDQPGLFSKAPKPTGGKPGGSPKAGRKPPKNS